MLEQEKRDYLQLLSTGKPGRPFWKHSIILCIMHKERVNWFTAQAQCSYPWLAQFRERLQQHTTLSPCYTSHLCFCSSGLLGEAKESNPCKGIMLITLALLQVGFAISARDSFHWEKHSFSKVLLQPDCTMIILRCTQERS